MATLQCNSFNRDLLELPCEFSVSSNKFHAQAPNVAIRVYSTYAPAHWPSALTGHLRVARPRGGQLKLVARHAGNSVLCHTGNRNSGCSQRQRTRRGYTSSRMVHTGPPCNTRGGDITANYVVQDITRCTLTRRPSSTAARHTGNLYTQITCGTSTRRPSLGHKLLSTPAILGYTHGAPRSTQRAPSDVSGEAEAG